MSGSRSHFFSAVLGGLVVAVVMAVLPATAANGDLMVVGTRNTARNSTKIISRNSTQLINTKAGRPALTLAVQPGAPPMVVNSTGKVTDLNADLLDGLNSDAFSTAAHDHDDNVRVAKTAVTSSTGGGSLIAVANCGSGNHAIGGGGNTNNSGDRLAASYPARGPDGTEALLFSGENQFWVARWNPTGTGTATRTAFAICVPN